MKLSIGRRQLLLAAGAAAAARAAPIAAKTVDVLAEALRYRKIDSHCHLLRESPRTLIDAADRLGITRMAISLPRGETPEQFRESNNRVLAAVREFPKRLLGQCFINPAHPKEALDELRRCLDAGMVGLGELYDRVNINDPLYYPIVEACIQAKAPLMMHARADLGLIRRGYKTLAPPKTSVASDFVALASRYPEAMLIHAHIGGGGDWEYMCKTLSPARNVMVDTSGSISDEGMIEFAVRYLGVERMLFATDMNFESGVGKILAARLTDQQRRAIFWDNYNNLLRKRANHAD